MPTTMCVAVSARAEALMHESMVRPDLDRGHHRILRETAPEFPSLKEG